MLSQLFFYASLELLHQFAQRLSLTHLLVVMFCPFFVIFVF
jgi:hypothetical protein